jgi:hypothetical protein
MLHPSVGTMESKTPQAAIPRVFFEDVQRKAVPYATPSSSPVRMLSATRMRMTYETVSNAVDPTVGSPTCITDVGMVHNGQPTHLGVVSLPWKR